MMSTKPRQPSSFDRPATYEIRVLGKIALSWSDFLEGMDIQVEKLPDGTSITTLTGELTDQAALAGVLNSIYEMHLPVVSVKWIDIG